MNGEKFFKGGWLTFIVGFCSLGGILFLGFIDRINEAFALTIMLPSLLFASRHTEFLFGRDSINESIKDFKELFEMSVGMIFLTFFLPLLLFMVVGLIYDSISLVSLPIKYTEGFIVVFFKRGWLVPYIFLILTAVLSFRAYKFFEKAKKEKEGNNVEIF